MRLVDADAFDRCLADAQSECKKNGGNFRYGVLNQVRGNLDEQPTIPAIPIDWLDARQTEAYKAVYYCKGDAKRNVEVIHAIQLVMELWEEEKDAFD